MKINQGTDYSALFSSLNTSSTGFSLNDYAQIKNGSYGKLMKAYYGKDTASSKTSSSSKKLDETATQNMNAVQKSADEFKEATESVKSAIADGDKEKIYKAAQGFADKYNSLMSSAGKVSNKNVTRLATNLMNEVASNLKLLSKAGFSVDKDGKMSVDEKSVKSDNNSALTSLFGRNSSFSDMVSGKAASIVNKAKSAVNASSTYTAKAAYNNKETSVGDFYDSFN